MRFPGVTDDPEYVFKMSTHIGVTLFGMPARLPQSPTASQVDERIRQRGHSSVE